MRINKYLAWKNYSTRREADVLIEEGRVLLNGKTAKLGEKVYEKDQVEVRFRPKKYRYFAYNKPEGIITHSPQGDETEIREAIPLKGVFPVGRLDKDSRGLMILTDDGRITDKLLNPDLNHEKEYRVVVDKLVSSRFEEKMEEGVDIEGYHTKRCEVEITGEKKFTIILTEGKKHQIRRMCSALGYTVVDLERIRIMNITLQNLKPGEYRALEGETLKKFLKLLGM